MSNSGKKLAIAAATLVVLSASGAGIYYYSDVAKMPTSLEPNQTESKPQSVGRAPEKQIKQAAKQPEQKTEQPAKPVKQAVKTPQPPSFDVMRVERSGDAVVAGRTEAGAIVALVANGEVLGKTVANSNGEFTIVLEKPLDAGDYDITLESQRDKNSKPIASKQHIAVSIPEDESSEALVVMNAPDAPSKVLQLPGQQSEPKQQIAQKEDKKQPEVQPPVKQEPVENSNQSTPAQQPQETLASVEKKTEQTTEPEQQKETAELRVSAVESENGKIYVAGVGEPGTDLRLYVGDKYLGQTTTKKDGSWLLEAPKELGNGSIEVRADQMAKDDQAKVVARAQVSFKKSNDQVILKPVSVEANASASGSKGNTATENIGALPSVIIRRGDNLWTISQRLYGSGFRYTTIYQANDNQIRDPDLIYPGQVFLIPSRDENWKDNKGPESE
ncbi:Ig-like domain-containing protein [Polycladidibacter stylochi]|uniref:Ig-like domain-containing protein n=1 Tax=Polycladidibacter stylochi TaxID=1807766 RepID=UPI000833004D|nr:Ig-like domain-containing protein [Pseudovibrio stylochi]